MEDLTRRLDEISRTDLNILPRDRNVELESLEYEGPILIFPDPLVSILISETVQNLRSSLDYLVFALARFDSGKFQEKTQFLIEDRRKVFEVKKRSRLCGLSPKHIAFIEKFQPYNGCDWTKLLRDISNHDKHRELIRVTAQAKFTVKVIQVRDTPTKLFRMPHPVDMKSRLSGDVTFSNGSPVIKTLQILKSQVANLLLNFDPIFSSYR